MTERLRFVLLKTVQMSGDRRHQHDANITGKTRFMVERFAISHVIFFNDIIISEIILHSINNNYLLVKSIDHESTSHHSFLL